MRIAITGIGGQQMPRPRDRRPTLLQRFKSRLGDHAVVRGQGTVRFTVNQLWEEGHRKGCFHLARMIPLVIENVRELVQDDPVPFDQKKVRRRGTAQLAYDRFDLVAAVTIEQHDLSNTAAHQRLNQIGRHHSQRGGIQVHRQGHGEHVGKSNNARLVSFCHNGQCHC